MDKLWQSPDVPVEVRVRMDILYRRCENARHGLNTDVTEADKQLLLGLLG